MSEITITNYALLGLLALRDWSAYDLVKQSQRVLGFLLPRAESRVYESVKRLVDLGFATSRRESLSGRNRSIYAITPAGRRTLQQWLHEPGKGPAVEFEGAIKLFFADSGTQPDAIATLDSVLAWAERMFAFGAAIGHEYVDNDGGPFPERLHVNALINEFLIRHASMVRDWAKWAREQVMDWDGVGPQPHRHDQDLQTYTRGAAALDGRPAHNA